MTSSSTEGYENLGLDRCNGHRQELEYFFAQYGRAFSPIGKFRRAAQLDRQSWCGISGTGTYRRGANRLKERRRKMSAPASCQKTN